MPESTKTKTILLIIPSLIKGGAEKIFLDQYMFYSSHYNTIGCIFNWDHIDKDQSSLSPFISLDVPAGKNVFQKIYFFWLRIYRLRALKKKHNVTISISHLEGADYVNILSRRRERIFCWIHGTKKFDRNIDGSVGWIRKKILLPFLYGKDKNTLITVSEGIRQELISFFKMKPDNVYTLYNGFDLNEITKKALGTPPLSLRALAGEKPILFTHCRLAKQKNLGALLQIKSLLQNFTGAKLFIVGDGELKEELYSQGERLGLKQYAWWKSRELTADFDVYFLGHYDNPFSLLKQATLYIMTSSWEGFPLALCEAMVCQVPVLASDCPTGPREILVPTITTAEPVLHPYQSPFGILMPLAEKENYDQWNSTIRNLLENPDLQKELAAGGEKRVANFDKKNTEKAWLKLVHG